MSYRVIWDRIALKELARIWTNAANKNLIARAASIVERLLMIDPLNEGIPISRGARQRYVTPLVVDFRVDRLNRLVKILHVRSPQTAP